MEDETRTSSDPLDRWMQRLHEHDIPVLGATVESLCQASDDRRLSAGDLAAVVLRDAMMTTRVLKLANSAFYNPAGYPINTISRAVVMLGFETVRSIGLSVAVIETFLSGKPKAHMIRLMRQAVYAAAAARMIAKRMRSPAPEQVFIAALLYRLGEMAFWSVATEREADALTEARVRRNGNNNAAEKEVLGCTLHALTARLAKEWRLSEILQEALRRGDRSTGRSAQVVLGHILERAVREHGWESPAVGRATERVAAHMKVRPERAREIIDGSRDELEQAAETFGVALDWDEVAIDLTAAAVEHSAREPQPMLQEKILRELASVLEKKPDVQVVLDMVMEGIYHGIAMDRALLSVLSPDRRTLKVKYVLGDTDDQLTAAFQLDLAQTDAAFIQTALEHGGSLWRQSADKPQTAMRSPAEIADDYFIAPLQVLGRDIGLIYADCGLSRRALDADCFEAFSHFIAQANLLLGHLTRR